MSVENELRDAIVVGGGAAGLGAALTLARARRSVAVIDAGQPRNAPADGAHGLLGQEGINPLELLERGRREVTGYGGEIRTGEVVDVAGESGAFVVSLRSGGRLYARRLVIATGLVDELPEIPGLREQWGRSVVHCPYCHGWEVSDRKIAVLGTGPMMVHQALLFHQWSRDISLFSRGLNIPDGDRRKLDALGIPVIPDEVAEVVSEGGRLTGVKLVDGTVHAAEAVSVGTRMLARAEVFAGIGITVTEHPMGSFIATDGLGRADVPGVWVAGNATDLSAQVGASAAEGSKVAAQLNFDLVDEDVTKAVAAAGTG
ncbi:NAD(P)/FAD-dependent oxidoreductase [Corynebacterium halotolerans]|uniref:FAD-dependent pyridine nucleotide-disulfide oxidoreductase n=1 Tax=Corynebacterium halotolerans YIM 70093 = DSM 44683 TaxID=1121362 RepID=M1NJV4_9CORY|nr:NAD(P)/FAD-dependent oxidoreductase [Corynebacterium halotolerans]AGF71683.1 FAD-dependent pyridine nucleotide-disulfide oxidoreductase [Corynebacterium halotolerans YIM 70093 = DSM 44683]